MFNQLTLSAELNFSIELLSQPATLNSFHLSAIPIIYFLNAHINIILPHNSWSYQSYFKRDLYTIRLQACVLLILAQLFPINTHLKYGLEHCPPETNCRLSWQVMDTSDKMDKGKDQGARVRKVWSEKGLQWKTAMRSLQYMAIVFTGGCYLLAVNSFWTTSTVNVQCVSDSSETVSVPITIGECYVPIPQPRCNHILVSTSTCLHTSVAGQERSILREGLSFSKLFVAA